MAVGYRPKRKLYNLDFTGTEHDGLEVTVRGMTVAEALEWDSPSSASDGAEHIIDQLAGLLVHWNVEDDDGQPVPVTVDGVRSQDATLVMAILTAVRTVANGVPDPLPSGSPSGEPSPAVSAIPTETLSPSPESYATPA